MASQHDYIHAKGLCRKLDGKPQASRTLDRSACICDVHAAIVSFDCSWLCCWASPPYMTHVLLARPQEFVDGLDGIPAEAKEALRQLTPATYVGNAAQQAQRLHHFL